MDNLSGKPQIMKKVNSGLIKQILKEKGSATKAEIAESTGISATTIRTLLNQLIRSSQIVSLGFDESSGGRRAERYALNLRDNLALSFYLKDNNLNYLVVNPLGNVIEDSTIKISEDNFQSFLEDFIDDILKKYSIKVIGIGVPGVVKKGSYFAGRELSGWKKFSIGEYIEKKYSIPVILENDLNATALGFSLNYCKEMNEKNKNHLNLIYIRFSKNGIGAGIIIDGKLIHGESNFAGEIGFIPVGHKGHFNSVLNDNTDDKTYIDIVSQVLAAINCIINPKFIVIGGEKLRSNLTADIKKYSRKYMADNIIPDIILSKDSRKDFLTGMAYLTIKLINSNIKLINT